MLSSAEIWGTCWHKAEICLDATRRGEERRNSSSGETHSGAQMSQLLTPRGIPISFRKSRKDKATLQAPASGPGTLTEPQCPPPRRPWPTGETSSPQQGVYLNLTSFRNSDVENNFSLPSLVQKKCFQLEHKGCHLICDTILDTPLF